MGVNLVFHTEGETRADGL